VCLVGFLSGLGTVYSPTENTPYRLGVPRAAEVDFSVTNVFSCQCRYFCISLAYSLRLDDHLSNTARIRACTLDLPTSSRRVQLKRVTVAAYSEAFCCTRFGQVRVPDSGSQDCSVLSLVPAFSRQASGTRESC